jgi:hypothetical protein
VVHRLAGAADASARAGHHFNQVVMALARPHLLGNHARIPQSVNDGQLQFRAIDRDGGFAQA